MKLPKNCKSCALVLSCALPLFQIAYECMAIKTEKQDKINKKFNVRVQKQKELGAYSSK